jgi:LysM repeat protein
MFLGGAGILFLVALLAISFQVGNRCSADAPSFVQVRVEQFGDKLTRLERIDNRIIFLEKQGKGLQQSISELDRSGKSLRRQFDILTQEVDQLQKTMASVALKTEIANAIQEKTISNAKMLYHEVRPGDTLFWIAKKYRISVDELCRINQTTPNQIIRPGRELLISLDIRP